MDDSKNVRKESRKRSDKFLLQSVGFSPGLCKHYMLLPALKDSFFKSLAFAS